MSGDSCRGEQLNDFRCQGRQRCDEVGRNVPVRGVEAPLIERRAEEDDDALACVGASFPSSLRNEIVAKTRTVRTECLAALMPAIAR